MKHWMRATLSVLCVLSVTVPQTSYAYLLMKPTECSPGQKGAQATPSGCAYGSTAGSIAHSRHWRVARLCFTVPANIAPGDDHASVRVVLSAPCTAASLWSLDEDVCNHSLPPSGEKTTWLSDTDLACL